MVGQRLDASKARLPRMTPRLIAQIGDAIAKDVAEFCDDANIPGGAILPEPLLDAVFETAARAAYIAIARAGGAKVTTLKGGTE